MNISKMQYTLKEKETIQNLLKIGIEPNTFEVSNRVGEYFDMKIPGLPYYSPISIKPHETSNPKEWNEMFKNLNTDLDIVYKTNVDQNNRIMTMEEYYLSEKEKVSSKLDKLQLRLTNLQDTIQSGKASHNFCQTFDSFYNIEFDGNPNRNIPYTTSFVDLLQKKVYSDKLSKARDKKDITKSVINITPISPFLDFQDSGDITSIFKDTINEFYIYSVRSKVNSELNVRINVTFPEPEIISSVVLSMTSSRNVSGLLSISEDGVNYSELYTVNEDSIMEWNFDSTPIKHLKIILKKQEADGYDNGLYEYYFVFKNISAISESFTNNSTYVSKPIVFSDTIDTITLKVNDLVFPHTNINYFVGIDDESNKINWQSIENGVPCNLNLLTNKTKIINKDLNSPVNIYGQSINDGCYRICKAPDNLNINSIQLKPGYQMWRAESLDLYKLNNKSASFDPEFYELRVNDYMRKNSISIGTIDNEEYRLTMKNGMMHVLTQYVFSERETILSSKYIKYISTNGPSDIKLQCKIYINNIEILPSDYSNNTYNYNLRLRQGKNKVQIIMFPNTKDKNYELSTIQVDHNINFKECTFDIFTAPQMKLTSIQSLRYKILQSNDKFYAIDEEGYIVVKYNPLTIFNTIVPTGAMTTIQEEERQMRYLLKYKTLSQKGAKKVTFKNGIPNVKFRVMATLLSSKEDVSPQILSYRIIGQ